MQHVDAARADAPRGEMLLIADFTVAGFTHVLNGGEAPCLRAAVAPFDQVVPILMDGTADCWKARPRFAMVWTRPHTAVKSFSRVLNHESVTIEEVLADVDQFAECLRVAAERVDALFVPTWTRASYDRGLGILNLRPPLGPSYCLMRMNARLAEAVSGDSRIHVLDAARWEALAGSGAHSPKLWHLGKIAFGPEVFRHAATDLKAAVRALWGQTRKAIVLDLDGTLWGGTVGDVGWEQLELGGHNPVGESFRAFQHALKRLSNRGIALAVASKNTEGIALEAIDRHPEMVLRRRDFAAWRVNWNDKVENILELSAELNLGLNGLVFIDDNPAERMRVREALPDVLVPEWPADKLLYEQALAELTCFDALTLTEEDRARTRMYVAERERTIARQSVQSLDAYLATLGLTVTVERMDRSNMTRAIQLLNKTNQFNLTTRRMTEARYLEWAASERRDVFVFRVSDRFDDYGLTGIASVSTEETAGHLTDFLLSCRVMGRGVEQTMLHAIAEHARSLGLVRLVATYTATERNAPCKQFFDEQSRFSRSADGHQFVWDLQVPYPLPEHVRIHRSTAHATAGVPYVLS
jgi:FkbH-like protein